jgi:hypothetical protein
VVSPGATEIAKRIGENYLSNARDVRLHDMTFEEYAETLAETMPSFMRQAAAEDTEVREWLERTYAISMSKSGDGRVS